MPASNTIAIVSVLVAVASTVATAGLIFLLFPIFRRYALARPNARSLHSVPTPQGGGGAVVVVTVAASAAAIYWVSGPVLMARMDVIAILVGAILIASVGMYDDIRPIPVAPRLALQMLIVAAVIYALPGDLRLFSPLPLWLERGLLILALTWFVNLVNFMDGMDFMSVIESTAIATGMILMWGFGYLPDFAGLTAVALLGAMWGFAWFNQPVARLFLGDVGSLPLGLIMGWLLVVLAGQGHFAAALILPLYYLVDATLTLLRRIVGGDQWWMSHRTHYYQKAHANGMTTWQVIVRVALLNGALIALAIFAAGQDGAMSDILALCVAGLLVAAVLMNFIRPRPAAKRVGAD